MKSERAFLVYRLVLLFGVVAALVLATVALVVASRSNDKEASDIGLAPALDALGVMPQCFVGDSTVGDGTSVALEVIGRDALAVCDGVVDGWSEGGDFWRRLNRDESSNVGSRVEEPFCTMIPPGVGDESWIAVWDDTPARAQGRAMCSELADAGWLRR